MTSPAPLDRAGVDREAAPPASSCAALASPRRFREPYGYYWLILCNLQRFFEILPWFCRGSRCLYLDQESA